MREAQWVLFGMATQAFITALLLQMGILRVTVSQQFIVACLLAISVIVLVLL